MKILTVTGYKPMEINIFNEADERIKYIKRALKNRLQSFIENGLEWVLISGQMGVELWTAEVIYELKKTYNIKLAVIPPFRDQAKLWPESLQFKYEELLMLADFHQPIYEDTYQGAYQFQAKDSWLINKSDGCLLLIDEENPGSVGYFKEKAEKVAHYPIYTITPFDLEDVVLSMQMEDPNYWD